jgi:opacity protein-like surface antigen
MKRFLLSVALLLSTVASAQSIKFGIHGNLINSEINAKVKEIAGISPSTGTLQVALDQVYGLGVGGGVHFDVNLSVLSIRISGDYITLSPDKDRFRTYVQQVVPGLPVQFVDGGRVDMISGSANLKLVVLPLPVLQPYISGGAGLANVRATDVTLSLNGTNLSPVSILKTQTVGTFNAGAGADIVLGGLTIFGEIKANWILLDEGTSTFVPIVTAGITF